MPLNVTLTENTLNYGLPLRPRVVNRVTVGFDEILRLMAMDTALEVADMRLAVERLRSALVFYVSKGNRVETPLGSFAAHVQGRRNGSSTTPEISAAGLKLRYTPDRSLRNEIQAEIEIEVLEQQDPKRPRIACIENVEDSGCVNECAPGQLLHIVGSRLSFDLDAADEGVFFVQTDGGEVRATVYSRHGSNIVDLKVPDLEPGEYTVELRARSHEQGELRNGAYANTVTVP